MDYIIFAVMCFNIVIFELVNLFISTVMLYILPVSDVLNFLAWSNIIVIVPSTGQRYLEDFCYIKLIF